MTDLTRCKCPICGKLGPIRITDSMLRCGYCGMTDSASQFKEVRAIPIDPGLYDAAQRTLEKNEIIAPRLEISREPLEPGTTQPLFDDEAFQTDLGNGTTLTTHFPPQDVVDAAHKVDDYFRQRGVQKWAYGPLQSREYDAARHPNLARAGLSGMIVGDDIQLADVRRLAFAFICDVVPRPTDEAVERVAQAMYETQPGAVWSAASRAEKKWFREAADAAKRQFGFQ